MSTTLDLADRLLARGRNFQQLGRDRDALHILGRLANFRELPPGIAEETQSRLAEILLEHGQYQQARRHLTAALVQRPGNARYHYLMATALAEDEKGDLHCAAEHYRTSLQLDPDQPACLAAFGLLAIRLGQVDEGLSCLRRAAELAPDDPEVVGQLADGLRQANQTGEARQVLRAALFRNMRDSRFRKMWNHFQFVLLREEQEAARQADAALRMEQEGPTLLPFVRPVPGAQAHRFGNRRVRRDGPSPLPPPHLPGTAPLSDRKRA